MHVLIAGAGVAGLEAALALSKLAEGLVDVQLLSPDEEFVYRPMLVAEPFGSAEVVRIPIAQVAADAGARHARDALASIDPAAGAVTTASGARLGYEALVVALGASPVEAVPGALTFGGERERRRFGELLGVLGRKGMRRIAFVVPAAVSWSIAAYELALLTAAECQARRLIETEITLVTHEAAPLGLFGDSASALVAQRLERAGISLRVSTAVERFVDGELRSADGAVLSADAAVALPSLEVGPLPGLPQRQHGMVHTDVGMRVGGMEDVWAAGDVTWCPIKQGGLAAQQADVAARSIAARAGAHVPIEPFQPVLRAALITGEAPQFLRWERSGREPSTASAGRSLWWPATKLAGRYLGPYLASVLGIGSSPELHDVEQPDDPAGSEAEHQRAVALVLAAADADARVGDFESAIRWLSLVEQLNLVIPSEYVARRHQWRRQLRPDPAAEPAAERIDPSFSSAAIALSDLQRRLGWLREIEHKNEGEMRGRLATLDDDLDHLIALSRRTGNL